MKYREETDSLGNVRVPENAYYGPQTQRAHDNFPISDLKLPQSFIRSLALIKKFAALTNKKLGLIDSEIAGAIAQAADQVVEGEFNDQFVVDVFQTGSGTSTNMNMNEVIATRANEILTGIKKTKALVHPNDHVNSGQSSNDVIPSAIHISAATLIKQKLIKSLKTLHNDLNKKSDAFKDIRKIGRTHLQDAVIMTLGNEFSGYTRQIELSIERLEPVRNRLCSLALGGTAVGTGLNAPDNFAQTVIEMIAAHTDIPFVESPNHFESQSTCDTAVETSGILKTIAVSLTKIANDIRWLASGPRCGLGEINLPVLQPGSSIMPGKVNPVICESVIQVGAQIFGNDAAITFGGQGGFFELNTMMPMIAYNLIQSIEIISNAADLLATKCVRGITANKSRCEENIQKSMAVATGLVPHIGYDRTAKIVQAAFKTGQTIEAVALEKNILPKKELMLILYGEKKEGKNG